MRCSAMIGDDQQCPKASDRKVCVGDEMTALCKAHADWWEGL